MQNLQILDFPYEDKINLKTTDLQITDHGWNFSDSGTSFVLDRVQDRPLTVWSQYIVDEQIKSNYPNHKFKLDIDLPHSTTSLPTKVLKVGHNLFAEKNNIKNFMCCFNGSNNITRHLALGIIYKQGWFNSEYCSKNFIFNNDSIDGKIQDYCGESARFYRKFFCNDGEDANRFYSTIVNFDYRPIKHTHNIAQLFKKIDQSFVQIVTETCGHFGYPFVTEKFVYPVVAKTFWVNYAQPGWHAYLTKYYGFKQYSIFDYSFDQIINPVFRILELISMLSKFRSLSVLDWHDLYLMEQDTIDYNYEWYFSGNYLRQLKHKSQQEGQ